MTHKLLSAVIFSLVAFCACDDGDDEPLPPATEQGVPGPVPTDDVPDDRGGGGDPDFNDAPFAPVASHLIQFYEWLGVGVTQEPAPNPIDAFNDGVFVVNPRNLAPGRVIVVGVLVSTQFAAVPGAFPAGSSGGLVVWVDWNFNSTFVAGEQVFAAQVGLPFNIGGVNFPRGIVQFPVRVPANFVPVANQFPPIRARLNWAALAPVALPGPGGGTTFGEVEDIRHPINDFSMINEGLKRGLLGEAYAFMRYDEGGEVKERQGFRKITTEQLTLIFADTETAELLPTPQTGPETETEPRN